MRRDDQLGIFLHQRLLNFARNKHGHLFAVNLLTVELDHDLLAAQDATQPLFPMTYPATLGPLDFVDAVRLRRPICEFLEGRESFDKLIAVARAIPRSWLGAL